jgi:hypothetical protein
LSGYRIKKIKPQCFKVINPLASMFFCCRCKIIFDAIKEKTNALAAERTQNTTSSGQGKKTIRSEYMVRGR